MTSAAAAHDALNVDLQLRSRSPDQASRRIGMFGSQRSDSALLLLASPRRTEQTDQKDIVSHSQPAICFRCKRLIMITLLLTFFDQINIALLIFFCSSLSSQKLLSTYDDRGSVRRRISLYRNTSFNLLTKTEKIGRLISGPQIDPRRRWRWCRRASAPSADARTRSANSAGSASAESCRVPPHRQLW
jgi:hypothetical protein